MQSIQYGHASLAQQGWSDADKHGWRHHPSGAMLNASTKEPWGPANEVTGWRQNQKGDLWHPTTQEVIRAGTSDTVAPQGVTQPANPSTYTADSASSSSYQSRHGSTARQEWSEMDETGWRHHPSGAIYNPATRETWGPANEQTGWRQNQKGDLWHPATQGFVAAEVPFAPVPGRAPGEHLHLPSVAQYRAGSDRDPAPVVARLEEAWERNPVEETEPPTPIEGGSWENWSSRR